MQDMQSSHNHWTVQQFAEVAGQPWYALQEHGPDGIERQYTGYAHEVAELAATLKVSPRQLPPTTEETFYASLNNRARNFELGRQFAADPSQGIRQDFAPYDLDRYAAGQQMRALEDNLRLETSTASEAHVLSGDSPAQQAAIRYGNAALPQHAAAENLPALARTEAAFQALELTPQQRQDLLIEYQGYALDRGSPSAAEALASAEREIALLGPVSPSNTRTDQQESTTDAQQQHAISVSF